jgi:hypothetical protein
MQMDDWAEMVKDVGAFTALQTHLKVVSLFDSSVIAEAIVTYAST